MGNHPSQLPSDPLNCLPIPNPSQGAPTSHTHDWLSPNPNHLLTTNLLLSLIGHLPSMALDLLSSTPWSSNMFLLSAPLPLIWETLLPNAELSASALFRHSATNPPWPLCLKHDSTSDSAAFSSQTPSWVRKVPECMAMQVINPINSTCPSGRVRVMFLRHHLSWQLCCSPSPIRPLPPMPSFYYLLDLPPSCRTEFAFCIQLNLQSRAISTPLYLPEHLNPFEKSSIKFNPRFPNPLLHNAKVCLPSTNAASQLGSHPLESKWLLADCRSNNLQSRLPHSYVAQFLLLWSLGSSLAKIVEQRAIKK